MVVYTLGLAKQDFLGLGAESWFVVASYAFAEMTLQCTEVRFSSLFSGGFITAIIVNPRERKLAKHTSVHWCAFLLTSP